jgi:multiple sugar transport system ATP-binding protein
VYFNPVNMFVAGFIGEPPMNFVRRTVQDGCITIGGHSIDLKPKLAEKAAEYEGKPIVFGFRPEAVVLGEEAGACQITGQVELTEMLGDNANVYMIIDEDHSILKVTPFEIPEMDSEVTFSVPYESVYLFDAETEKVL